MTYPSGPDLDESVIREHLRTGEKLLWSGRPDPNKQFAPGDWYLVPFSLVWTGMVIFIGTRALWDDKGPLGAKLFLIPFLLVALYITIGRFVVKRRGKLRTRYALTDRRAIIAGPRQRVIDVVLDAAPIDQRPSRDGRHLSVTFGERRSSFWSGNNAPQNTGMDFFHQGPPAFYDVGDVEGLRRALRAIGR